MDDPSRATKENHSLGESQLKQGINQCPAAHLAIVAFALVGPAALAQTTPLSALPSVGLEEIVVTAQKRSENLQDVPIAITAVSAITLSQNRVLTTQDIQFLAPALLYNQAGDNAQPFMRGIGSDLTGPNLDASVATYIDGVYVSNNAGTVTSLLGIDRVEVLEGPQGTLFGRNAVGGAISLYTLTPKDTDEASFDATFGNYSRTQFSGYASGPLASDFDAGVYVAYDRRKSYDTILNPADPQHEDRWGVRTKFVYTPTDAITLTGSAEFTSNTGFETAALWNIQPDALGYALGARQIIAPYVYDDDLRQFLTVKTQAYTLREQADLGFASLIGITGYRYLNAFTGNNLDGTNAPLLADTATDNSRQFSQELQLVSKPGSYITWLGGLYGFGESTGYFPTAIISSVVYPPPIVANVTTAQVSTRSYAAFGQATIPLDFLTQGMRLTLGERYTRDQKEFTASSFSSEGTGYPNDPLTMSAVIHYPYSSASWSRFTPKITIDDKFGDTLVYATYSQGFKGGAYNIATPSESTPVAPERLYAYEIGTKSEFADGRVRLNTAAYHYLFKDLQVSIIDSIETGATSLQNAGAGKAYGAEAALTVIPVQGLTLDSSLSMEHTEYTSFPNAASFIIGPNGNTSAIFNATGNQLERAPKFVFNVGGDYKFPLPNGAVLDTTAKWYHNSGFYWEPTDRFRQSAYSIVNLSSSYEFLGDHFSITAWVSNLTNQYYQTALLLLPTSIDVKDAEPRMCGVSFKWKL
jgi:iron complex outermembrane recepter protein